MKKVSFLIIAALVAASSVWVGCTKEDDPITPVIPEIPVPKAPPTINLSYGGEVTQQNATKTAKVGDVVELIVTYSAPGEIKQIDFKVGDVADPSKTTGFQTASTELIKKSITFEKVGTVTITTTISDKQTPTLQATFTITVKVERSETPLSEAKEFTLTYTGSTQTNGQNENKDVGIKYAINVDATTARFEIIATTANKFVPLTKEAFDAIKLKEDLEDMYEQNVATLGIDRFTRESDAKFQPYYLISKVGNTYFLVEMKSLKFVAGNNKAVFSYQK